MSSITNIDRWLKANRCWRREHNIAHALYMCPRANEHMSEARAFWELILERLGDG